MVSREESFLNMKKIKTITICGGGGLGIVCAGVFLSKGVKVNILTGHPGKWESSIVVYDPEGRVYSGELSKISSNPMDVIPGSDMVLLTVPGYLIERELRGIAPFLDNNTIVGSVVSSTGFFFVAHRILSKYQTLFGFQRVPFIARVREYGKSGDLLGYKNSLNVAIENCAKPIILRENLETLFGVPICILNNYYEASLTNSNPILHTGRLYSMWGDYAGKIYPEQSKFYAEWTDASSEKIIQMDEEFGILLDKLGINRTTIPSLLDYYESKNAKELTEKSEVYLPLNPYCRP